MKKLKTKEKQIIMTISASIMINLQSILPKHAKRMAKIKRKTKHEVQYCKHFFFLF